MTRPDADALADRFDAMFEAQFAQVLAYALRRTPLARDAADVVGETFLFAWRRMAEVPSGEDTLPWLFRVAREVLGNHDRTSRRRIAAADQLRERVASLPPRTSAPATGVAARIPRALSMLSESDSELLQLTHWELLGPARSAAALGIRPKAAQSQLPRAISSLRTTLAELAFLDSENNGPDDEHELDVLLHAVNPVSLDDVISDFPVDLAMREAVKGPGASGAVETSDLRPRPAAPIRDVIPRRRRNRPKLSPLAIASIVAAAVVVVAIWNSRSEESPYAAYDYGADQAMPIDAPLYLPPSNEYGSVLLRTDFGNEVEWAKVCAEASAPVEQSNGVSSMANLQCVSDPAYSALEVADILQASGNSPELFYVFVADEQTMSDSEHPILALDLQGDPGRSFRLIPAEMSSVENNLALSNSDFFEFADAVDSDGVYRGSR